MPGSFNSRRGRVSSALHPGLLVLRMPPLAFPTLLAPSGADSEVHARHIHPTSEMAPPVAHRLQWGTAAHGDTKGCLLCLEVAKAQKWVGRKKEKEREGEDEGRGQLRTRPCSPQTQEGSPSSKSHPNVDTENARKQGGRDRPSRQLAILFWAS